MIEQEMLDWKNHPITRNYYEAVNEAMEFYKKSLAKLDSDFDEREVARKIGVMQGLEALLTYDPDFDKDGVIISES